VVFRSFVVLLNKFVDRGCLKIQPRRRFSIRLRTIQCCVYNLPLCDMFRGLSLAKKIMLRVKGGGLLMANVISSLGRPPEDTSFSFRFGRETRSLVVSALCVDSGQRWREGKKNYPGVSSFDPGPKRPGGLVGRPR
jgi:hypothetical protein